MKKTFTAIFTGGDRCGTTLELKNAHPKIISILIGVKDNGLTEVERTTFNYYLFSVGPPLHYKLA